MKFSILLTMIIGSSMIFGTLSIPHADAAVDMFIKIGDIKGESQDDKHKGEIDVLSWSWGMSNSGTVVGSGGAGAGKANFQDLSVTKYLDKSSPLLMLHAANGAHIEDADLFVRKAGFDKSSSYDFLVFHMEDVLVTSLSTGGSGGEDRLTENITLNFGKIKVSYTPQKADGSPDVKTEFNWNIKENTP